jgi:dihydrofolate reductase
MYDVMKVWEHLDPDGSAAVDDFGRLWRAADKVVFSRTLDAVSTPRTRVERSFDAVAVRQLVEGSAGDTTVSGAQLAAEALRAGLVDELQQLVNPVVVGGGTRWLPDDVRLDLELTETRRFASGVVFVRYAVRR